MLQVRHNCRCAAGLVSLGSLSWPAGNHGNSQRCHGRVVVLLYPLRRRGGVWFKGCSLPEAPLVIATLTVAPAQGADRFRATSTSMPELHFTPLPHLLPPMPPMPPILLASILSLPV
jgi:hypothetical protein